MMLWAAGWYVLFNVVIWFLLFDEYETMVIGFQQTILWELKNGQA